MAVKRYLKNKTCKQSGKCGCGKCPWRARIIGPDGRQRVAFRSRRDDAIEAERKLIEEARQPDDPQSASVTEDIPTVRDFQDRWLEHQATMNSKSEMKHKRQILRDHVLADFGDARLDQITALSVDGYKSRKLAELAPSTVANHVALIKRMLGQARDWNIIDKVPRIRQVKVPPSEFDFLDFAESERFLEHAGSWRDFMLIAIRTGLRLGELRGLQWGDIDLEGRRIRVVRAFTQTGWGRTKSQKGRTVDLSRDAVDVLERLKPKRVARTALVFPGPSGRPLDEKACYKACQRASKGAELGRVIGPHKLRHTFASHHAMRGTPLPVIQAWMGHADITTTMRYSHLCPSATAGFADNVASRGLRLVAARDDRGVTSGVTGDGVTSKNAV